MTGACEFHSKVAGKSCDVPRFTPLYIRSRRAARMELPAATLSVLKEAAAHSADGRTVALVFATHDFAELVLNWCLTALRAGVRWFTVVAMDAELQALLERGGVGAPVVLLPRAQQSRHVAAAG